MHDTGIIRKQKQYRYFFAGLFLGLILEKTARIRYYATQASARHGAPPAPRPPR